MTVSEILNQVDELPLEKSVYAEFLEEIISDAKTRLEAVKAEIRDELQL